MSKKIVFFLVILCYSLSIYSKLVLKFRREKIQVDNINEEEYSESKQKDIKTQKFLNNLNKNPKIIEFPSIRSHSEI